MQMNVFNHFRNYQPVFLQMPFLTHSLFHLLFLEYSLGLSTSYLLCPFLYFLFLSLSDIFLILRLNHSLPSI